MLSYSRFCLVVVVCLLIVSGCRPQPRPVQQPTPAPKPEITAEQSWNEFVADARSECESQPGCSVDYEKLHEYDGRHFGVMIVGYEDSEYFVSLYRFDPDSNEWVESPRSTPADGYEHIDVPATSEQWDVPEATIKGWIDEANRTVREIYSKRQ